MKVHNILLAILMTVSIAQAELTAEFDGSKGSKEAELDGLIKKIDTIGYSTVAVNKHIEVHYHNKFKEKNVEMLSFFAMVNKEAMRPLILKNPDFGAYTPFNFLAYKTLDTAKDDNTWYGTLSPEVMLNIIGEKDSAMREEFTAMIGSFDALVKKEMKPTMTKKFEHSKPLPEKGLIKMVKSFETPDDIEEYVEEFVMDHDGRFAKRDFIIAGFLDLKFEYADMDLEFEGYDAYWISMLCHFEFSNSIFNRGKPEAGMFAPCSIYFYIPKGKNELHVGYASVNNWINALELTDQKRIDYMKKIDAEVIAVLTEMGFKQVQ